MRAWIAIWLVAGAVTSADALFTGNDQYDRRRLNTERLLDKKYFLGLLAYRPFWEPDPGDPLPAAFVRNTEGSLNTNDLFVRREVGLRGRVSDRGFFGYQLRQWEDLEENSLYQYFEGQFRIAGPLWLRFFGAPSGQKEDSDIGLGGVIEVGGSSVTVNWTWVDYVFNAKTDRPQHDRRDLAHLQVEWTTRDLAGWKLAAAFDVGTPVEREYRDDDELFTHRAAAGRLRAVVSAFDMEAGWRRERRTTAVLSSSAVDQDFRKDVVFVHPAWRWRWGRIPGRVGLLGQRRQTDYTHRSAMGESERRQRWEWDPYVTGDVPLTPKSTLELGFYTAFLWEDWRSPAAAGRYDRSFEAKLKTGLRLDFSPTASLLLSPTLDVTEIGSRNTFGGGNVQFRAVFF